VIVVKFLPKKHIYRVEAVLIQTGARESVVKKILAQSPQLHNPHAVTHHMPVYLTMIAVKFLQKRHIYKVGHVRLLMGLQGHVVKNQVLPLLLSNVSEPVFLKHVRLLTEPELLGDVKTIKIVVLEKRT
jgi:Zn finger protein HypA/HybF involved in hydrogenase expression